MRLIDADELMKAMYHRAFETDGDTMWQSGCWVRYRAIEQVVKELPTADTVRHGQWIKRTGGAIGYDCSVCGESDISNHFDYCPNCGAKMGGAER